MRIISPRKIVERSDRQHQGFMPSPGNRDFPSLDLCDDIQQALDIRYVKFDGKQATTP